MQRMQQNAWWLKLQQMHIGLSAMQHTSKSLFESRIQNSSRFDFLKEIKDKFKNSLKRHYMVNDSICSKY